jgi:transposase
LARLNALFNDASFDQFDEKTGQRFYAPVMGRPRMALGRYLRLLLLG